MIQGLLCLLLLLLLVSCGSSTLDADFHSPTVRFQTPETTGKTLGLRAQGSFGSSHRVSMARTRQTRTLINNTPSAIVFDRNVEYSVSNELGYGADVGILSRLDFVFSKRTYAHYRFGGKLQLLGTPGTATPGVKVALMGSYGYQKKRDLSSPGIFEKKEDYTTVTGDTTAKSTDYAGMVGYRVSSHVLYYLIGFQDQNKAHTTLSVQQQSDINLENTFKTRGLNLGLELAQGSEKDTAMSGAFVLLEGGFSEIVDVEGLKVRHRTYGVAVGARF